MKGQVQQDFVYARSFGNRNPSIVLSVFKTSRVKKNISRNQVSIALFLSSNIHQGDEIFSVQSRGMQCAFMTHSARFKNKRGMLFIYVFIL